VQGGRYLKTGSDVVRTLNALRLHALPVRSLIDIADMVWLQLIRVGNLTFYSWIEEYLTEIAALASGGVRVSDEAADEIASEKLNTDCAVIGLAEILPGLDTPTVAGRERRRHVFNQLNEHAINRFVTAGRLGSPQHYRYYFAFSQPDEQVQVFINAAEHAPEDAIQRFASLGSTNRPQGGTMAEVIPTAVHYKVLDTRLCHRGHFRQHRPAMSGGIGKWPQFT
jgi:hypothetical protein